MKKLKYLICRFLFYKEYKYYKSLIRMENREVNNTLDLHHLQALSDHQTTSRILVATTRGEMATDILKTVFGREIDTYQKVDRTSISTCYDFSQFKRVTQKEFLYLPPKIKLIK